MLKNQKIIVAVFFYALLIFVAYQLVVIFRPFFEAFFWASILTFAVYPLYRKLERLIGSGRLAALAATLLIFLIVILPAIFILGNLIAQTLEIYQHVSEGGLTASIQKIRDLPWLREVQTRIERSSFLTEYLADWPVKITRSMADFATSQIASWTKNILLIFFNFSAVIFLIYVLLRQGERIYQACYRLFPLEPRDKKMVFEKINETFASVIRGQFVTSAVQAVLTGLTFFFLGLPAPYFFGFVTFICTMIPVLGATSVWLPFALYLLFTGQMVKGGILVAVGVLLISAIDNVLKPILIGERTKIPLFILFFGVLGGLRAYGMTGIFLGPVFIAIFTVLIKIYQDRYQET